MTFNFLDKADTRLRELHNILDSLYSKLHAGVGAIKRSAAVITMEDENLLWEASVISFESPQTLQNMIFYYVGLHFCLHDLTVQQLIRHSSDLDSYDDSTYYQYVELISKHRFKDIHMKNKTTKVYAMVGSTKCMVKMLDFYISKLPQDPKSFHLRPLKSRPTDDTKPWYIKVPVGVNTLKGMLPKMFKEAGTKSRYTNHSLRATSTTRQRKLFRTSQDIAHLQVYGLMKR